MFKATYDPSTGTLTISGPKTVIWIDCPTPTLRKEAEWYDKTLIHRDTVQNVVYEFSERGAVVTQITQS